MIPAAVAADLAAALEDYRLITPRDQRTPEDTARFALEQLAGSGWTIRYTAPRWRRAADRLRRLYGRLAAEHPRGHPKRHPGLSHAPTQSQEPTL